MVALLVPLGLAGWLTVMIALIARMFSDISLNRTVREALRTHPESVPALTGQLNARRPWADALIGWIFIAFAVGLALMSLFEDSAHRGDILEAAIVTAVTGIVVLAYARWAEKAA